MTRKKAVKEPDLIDQMLDQIDFKGLSQEEVPGQDGILKRLTGRLLQKILEAEMTEHLGYEKNSNAGDNSPYMAHGNSRNGYGEETVLMENQEAVIQVPRDRAGTFEPVIIPKRSKRAPLFNDQIISMYAHGMTDRQIKEQRHECRWTECTTSTYRGNWSLDISE